jgi:3-deoxy-manno-octulosonate cytidylyltransferase (CMP-KDO synthetase)
MKYAVVIPARYQSSRLPGKPLVDLCGVPMIVRTYRQCAKACPAELIYVATDDNRVRAVCEENGIKVLMTSRSCLTGTDRVAECAERLDADVFVNIQGDEPIFPSEDISALICEAQRHPDEVLNGMCAIDDEKEQFRNPSVPKAVVRPDGRLLYMSRASIPTTKTQEFIKSWRQVCAYTFPRKALEAFSRCGRKTLLEQIEDIEILRFLELGLEVRMVQLSNGSLAVDTPEDVERIVKLIRQRER